MPIYEYDCQTCRKPVEVLLRTQSETPACPDCGGEKLERLMSVPASPAIASGRSLPTAAAPGQDCGMPRCCGGGCSFE